MDREEWLRMRSEAVEQIKQAVEHWGMSQVEVDDGDPTVLYATLRSPNSSRTFVATIQVTHGREV